MEEEKILAKEETTNNLKMETTATTIRFNKTLKERSNNFGINENLVETTERNGHYEGAKGNGSLNLQQERKMKNHFIGRKRLKPRLDESLLCFYAVEKELIGGRRKEELTNWWLHLIEESVAKFIESVPGMTPNAIPYQYLDQAPKSLEVIEKNLEILRQLIDPTKYGDKYQVKDRLIDPLCFTIYLEIDSFLQQAQLLCVNLLLEALIENEEEKEALSIHSLQSLDYEFVKQSFSKVKGSQNLNDFMRSKLKEMEGLVRDIEYILEMKKLEQDFRSRNQKQENGGKVSDIVPISGLILGVLHRMENEHKTVFEHWSPRIRSSRTK